MINELNTKLLSWNVSVKREGKEEEEEEERSDSSITGIWVRS